MKMAIMKLTITMILQVSYIQEYYTSDNILQVVDHRVADGWESSNAVAIYNLAKKLLRNKNTRPLISDVSLLRFNLFLIYINLHFLKFCWTSNVNGFGKNYIFIW